MSRPRIMDGVRGGRLISLLMKNECCITMLADVKQFLEVLIVREVRALAVLIDSWSKALYSTGIDLFRTCSFFQNFKFSAIELAEIEFLCLQLLCSGLCWYSRRHHSTQLDKMIPTLYNMGVCNRNISPHPLLSATLHFFQPDCNDSAFVDGREVFVAQFQGGWVLFSCSATIWFDRGADLFLFQLCQGMLV